LVLFLEVETQCRGESAANGGVEISTRQEQDVSCLSTPSGVFFSGNRPSCDFQDSHYFKKQCRFIVMLANVFSSFPNVLILLGVCQKNDILCTRYMSQCNKIFAASHKHDSNVA
jgi:hypothetical protein